MSSCPVIIIILSSGLCIHCITLTLQLTDLARNSHRFEDFGEAEQFMYQVSGVSSRKEDFIKYYACSTRPQGKAWERG